MSVAQSGKILIVQFSSDRNGSAISGLLLANGLRERGWETFVVFAYPGPMELDYQLVGHQTAVVEHKNWLRRSNPLRFAKDLWAEWRKVPSFLKLMKSVNPDVIYINTAVSLVAAFAARKLGIKTIWHMRELFSDVGGEMFAPKAVKPFIRAIFKNFSDVLVIN